MSNLLQYYTIDFAKVLVNKMSLNLNEGGELLICYFYKTVRNIKYYSSWAEIYNLDKTFKIFDQYNPQLESFIGTRRILFGDTKDKDSILSYKKR